MNKHIFVVLGMPRSGTSAITRGLQALGVDLGDHLIPGNDKWNAKGFFEDDDIVYKINRRVLLATDRCGMFVDLSVERCEQDTVLRELKRAAVYLLQKRLQGTNYWAFKDPRTAKVLPFWEAVFRCLDVQDHYIFSVRNPLSSAQSYQHLSGCDLEEALLLWLAHLLPAIDATMGKQRMMVCYESLLENPHQELARMQCELNLPSLTSDAEKVSYATQFLDKKLHHYAATDKELRTHPAIMAAPLCLQAYDLFMRLARDEITFHDDVFLNAWQEIKRAFAEVYPIYAYTHNILKKNKHMQRELRTIHRSLPWKLIYPLRLLDDFLRRLRHKAREKNRLVKIYE